MSRRLGSRDSHLHLTEGGRDSSLSHKTPFYDGCLIIRSSVSALTISIVRRFNRLARVVTFHALPSGVLSRWAPVGPVRCRQLNKTGDIGGQTDGQTGADYQSDVSLFSARLVAVSWPALLLRSRKAIEASDGVIR